MRIFSICFFQSWNSAAQTYPSGPRRSKAAPWVTELKAPAPFLCSEYEEILVTPGNLKSMDPVWCHIVRVSTPGCYRSGQVLSGHLQGGALV